MILSELYVPSLVSGALKVAMPTPIPKPPYSKPPIIDCAVHLSVDGTLSPDELAKLARRFAKDYPKQEILQTINVALNTTGGEAVVEQRQQGHRIASLDGADVILFFPDGVAVGRLPPYPAWEHLQERAQNAWRAWREIRYTPVKRIGVRYINRLDVPIKDIKGVNVDAFLNFGLRIPEIFTQPMAGFLAQATLQTGVKHWNTTVTATILSPSPLINHVSLLLDIDIFRTEVLPNREQEIWACIEEVRPLKNSIFEACITDEGRRLFG